MIRMTVNALISHIGFDVATLDSAIEGMERSAKTLPDGSSQRTALEDSVKAMRDNREKIVKDSKLQMAHVQFVDEAGPHGAANFLIERGQLEEGATYSVAFTKEATP